MGRASRRKREGAAPAAGNAPAPAPDPGGRGRAAAAGIILVACAILCAPLWLHDPLPRGSDIFAIIHYLDSFMEAFGQGDLLPRWSMNTNRGLGGPAFIMFPPLFFYWAGAASWAAGGIVLGMKLVLTMIALATALGFHLLAREWGAAPVPAAAGAAVYLLLPYHVLDLYQRTAMPETTAFVLFPPILLFLRRVLRGGSALDAVALALSYAALIYTHVISSFSFSLVLGVWLLWECRRDWKRLLRPVLVLVAGLGLASPALIPAAELTTVANVDWIRQMPNGDFRINFIFKDPVLPGLGIKDPVKPLVLRSAHSQLFLAAAALWLAWVSLARGDRPGRGLVVLLGSASLLSYLMQVRISTPVWHLVPPLKSIQFPWRFQTYLVLACALLVALALSACLRSPSRKQLPPLAAMGALFLINLGFSYQNAFAKPFDFTEEAIRSDSVRYWVEPSLTPLQFTRFMRFRFERIEVPESGFVDGAGTLAPLEWEASTRRLSVSSEAGGRVLLRTFWFPGWRARIDGESLDLAPSERDGLLTFRVPPGEHEVLLEFGATTAGRAAAWIAALSLIGLGLYGIARHRAARRAA